MLWLLLAYSMALAPLEQENNTGIYFGAWWDRLNGDNPSAINKRIGYKPLSMFQSDVNISNTIQGGHMDNIEKQVSETGTTAILYLTVYPNLGFEAVTQNSIDEMAYKIGKWTNNGTKVFLRYAPEMNGAWFAYSQQPSNFTPHWKNVVNSVRKVSKKDNIAFIWAPNSGNGYPYVGSLYHNSTNSDPLLDTNADGIFDEKDDPYSPYYPGDEWVDWVGLSVYHYGSEWLNPKDGLPSGWVTNDLPEMGKFENIITGNGSLSTVNFYSIFSSKPIIITETGAPSHLSVITENGTWVLPETTSLKSKILIKRTWWRQIFNREFLKKYDRIKAVCFFEFVKFEEKSLRDFTVLGYPLSIISPLGVDEGSGFNILKVFRNDLIGYGSMIKWAADNIKPVVQPTSSSDLPLTLPLILIIFLI